MAHTSSSWTVLYNRELDACQKRVESMEGLYAQVAEAIFAAAPEGRILDV